jgi:hypothetical protein
MIPLTLALSLQGRGDYSWFLPLEGGRVKYQYYFETVNTSNCLIKNLYKKESLPHVKIYTK